MTLNTLTKILAPLAAPALLLSCSGQVAQEPAMQASESPAFSNAVNDPPPGWNGHVFRLSHNYPASLPAPPESGFPWKQYDFKTQPSEYIYSVLNYARADLEGVDWDPLALSQPNWFHSPWMAYGDDASNAREFVQGMTKERSSRAGELSPQQTTPFISNYAVGLYNDVGGWTFGKVWQDPESPQLAAGAPNFSDGAMAIKLLFTQADPEVPADGVPFLEGSKTWQANVAPFSSSNPQPRSPKTLRLLQVDIAVRDARNDDLTGWLFGTFVYNNDAPGRTPLDKLVPVGLMWGDSPGFLPAQANAGANPPEQWINESIGLYQHYGWAKRINGPVDNPASSCISCHGGSAETPVTSNMIPPTNLPDAQKLPWFTNIKSGQAKDPGSISLDFSLQMSVAVQNWSKWNIAKSGMSQARETNATSEFTVTRGDDD